MFSYMYGEYSCENHESHNNLQQPQFIQNDAIRDEVKLVLQKLFVNGVSSEK